MVAFRASKQNHINLGMLLQRQGGEEPWVVPPHLCRPLRILMQEILEHRRNKGRWKRGCVGHCLVSEWLLLIWVSFEVQAVMEWEATFEWLLYERLYLFDRYPRLMTKFRRRRTRCNGHHSTCGIVKQAQGTDVCHRCPTIRMRRLDSIPDIENFVLCSMA